MPNVMATRVPGDLTFWCPEILPCSLAAQFGTSCGVPIQRTACSEPQLESLSGNIVGNNQASLPTHGRIAITALTDCCSRPG
jgi:hypothetical protein